MSKREMEVLMVSVLNYIFNICIIIGFVIPLLNLLTGWFGSFFGAGADMNLDVDLDADFDVGAGADLHGDSGGIIPFNIMCLCLFLVVFGALGHMAKRLMSTPLFTVLLIIGCLILAGLSYWALYKFFIMRLKQNDASALSYQDLQGKSAEVTLSIQADSLGMISLRDSTGGPISFRAKIDPDLKDHMPAAIMKGERVVITEVDTVNKICYVSVSGSKYIKNIYSNNDMGG